MSNSRLIGVVAAIVALALVIFGVYHFRNKAPVPETKPQAEQSQPTPEAQKTEGEATPSGQAEPSKSADVPSFDVVRVEGTGEGVIAGRAAPGWTIKIESDGNTIAETKADDEGAWTVVLDQPLSAGDHSLTLKAISPDGTSSLTAQQPVKVAVAEGSAPTPAGTAGEATKPEGSEGEGARPTPVRFEDVQYEDTGADSGKLKMSGTGAPGSSILLYLDDKPLGQVTIGPDGTWSFEADAKIDNADHALRADLIQAGTGIVAGRTAAAFRRNQQTAASSQPQPVYPDGPLPSSTAPAAPTSTAAAEPVSTANQPQPVYPDASSVGSAAPSTSVAQAEPSLSSQPQPVYPSETPSAEAPAAASSAASSQPQPAYPDGPPPAPAASAPSAPAASPEPVSTASQPQPVVPPEAPASEPTAIVAETPGTETAPRKEPMVVFRGVDYNDTDTGSGKVKLSGTGEPGSRIVLFFDGAPLGEATIGADGAWSFEAEQKLATGEHIFRADRIDPATGTVAGSAQIGMARMAPAPKEEVAAQEPAASPEVAAPSGEEVASEDAQPAPVAKKQRPKPRVYTVRRGDTLWEIAEYYFGGGWRYHAIVRDNRRKIKDPHWIYPKQKFHIPSR